MTSRRLGRILGRIPADRSTASDANTPGEYFDSLANEYHSSFRNNLLAVWARERAHALYAQALRPGSRRIGDFGCGHGEDTLFLAQFAEQVIAVDASAEMLQLTRTKVENEGISDRVITVRSDLRDFAGTEYDASSFDAIILGFGVVNCFDPVSDTLERVAQLLAPAGTLIVSTLTPHNPLDLVLHLARGSIPDRWRQQPQLATYDDRQLLTYARSAKEVMAVMPRCLELVHSVGVGTVLPPAHGDAVVQHVPGLVRQYLKSLDKYIESTCFAMRFADMVWLVLRKSTAS